jgi:hypothetical protein
MFYVRSPCAGSQEAIGGALALYSNSIFNWHINLLVNNFIAIKSMNENIFLIKTIKKKTRAWLVNVLISRGKKL